MLCKEPERETATRRPRERTLESPAAPSVTRSIQMSLKMLADGKSPPSWDKKETEFVTTWRPWWGGQQVIQAQEGQAVANTEWDTPQRWLVRTHTAPRFYAHLPSHHAQAWSQHRRLHRDATPGEEWEHRGTEMEPRSRYPNETGFKNDFYLQNLVFCIWKKILKIGSSWARLDSDTRNMNVSFIHSRLYH